MLHSPVRFAPRRGFTLLELLVVLAILATVGGGLLVAFDGLEERAAKAQATNTLASLDASVRAFTVTTRQAPSDLDSLLALDTPTTPAGASTTQPIATLSASLAGKLQPLTLDAGQAAALLGAGIGRLRYIDAQGNQTAPGTYSLSIPAEDGSPATVGPITEADIPARIFDAPRPGTGRNRGRAASGPLAAGAPVMAWIAGPGGTNNTKLGAAADHVLVAFGLGNSSTLVAAGPEDAVGVKLASAPFYTDVLPAEYGRYLLLYDLGPAGAPFSKARLQAVVDAKGDFLDEEYAEYTGSKS